jgi:glycosyltransferase involved in cell wall biosynthesis
MRIAIISDHRGWEWAGCEDVWFAAASQALERGHKVAVFLCRRNVPEKKLKPLIDLGMELHLPGRSAPLVERARRISWKLGNLIAPWSAPFQAIEKFSPDVLLYNAGDAIPHSAVLDLIKRTRALRWPYVVVCNNSHLFDPPPTGSHREAAVELYQGARLVLSPAARAITDVEQMLAARVFKSRVVRNPVGIKDTSSMPMPADSVVRIAHIGRLDYLQKGQDTLLAALGACSFRQEPWELSLYGDGGDRNHLLRLAELYGISGRVAAKGYSKDIRGIWAETHLLALPSRFETAPIVMTEAMLCGRPCVVTDVGGMTEWIREPETGFVSPGIHAESFRAALERAWAARSDWAAIGLRAHKRAEKLRNTGSGNPVFEALAEVAGEIGALV